MIIDIKAHRTRNGMNLTIDTRVDTYEYSFKDLPTLVRKLKHVFLEIEQEEQELEVDAQLLKYKQEELDAV